MSSASCIASAGRRNHFCHLLQSLYSFAGSLGNLDRASKTPAVQLYISFLLLSPFCTLHQPRGKTLRHRSLHIPDALRCVNKSSLRLYIFRSSCSLHRPAIPVQTAPHFPFSSCLSLTSLTILFSIVAYTPLFIFMHLCHGAPADGKNIL